MKTRNIAKLLVLVLSLALLIGSVAGISVSAANVDNLIAAQTIVHGAKIQIAVAVNAPSADGVTVTYQWAGEDTAKDAKYDATVNYKDGTVVFVTEGVAAYELAKVATIIVSYNGNTQTKTYSVAQFLYTKLYSEKVGGAAAACYNALLNYGVTSQNHLGVNTNALVTDSFYVYSDVEGVTLNGDDFLFGAPNTSITVIPAYNGAGVLEGWTYGPTGSENELAVGESATVSATTKFIPTVGEAGELPPVYGTDFESSVTSGVKLATGSAVYQTSFTLGETYTPATKSGVWGNIVSVTKKFENGREEVSNVLKLTINDGVAKNTTLGTLGGEGTFYYAPAISSNNNGNLHILEFDFNWAQASKKGFRNPISLFAYDAQGNMLGNIVDANGKDNEYCVWTINNGGAFNEGTVVENAYQLGISGTQVEVEGGKFRLFNSDTWYRLRYIWDKSNGQVYISASDDNGETWYQACTMQTKKPYADAAYLAFSCDQLYGLGGYVYLDNINYNIVSELPELPADNGL